MMAGETSEEEDPSMGGFIVSGSEEEEEEDEEEEEELDMNDINTAEEKSRGRRKPVREGRERGREGERYHISLHRGLI